MISLSVINKQYIQVYIFTGNDRPLPVTQIQYLITSCVMRLCLSKFDLILYVPKYYTSQNTPSTDNALSDVWL